MYFCLFFKFLYNIENHKKNSWTLKLKKKSYKITKKMTTKNNYKITKKMFSNFGASGCSDVESI